MKKNEPRTVYVTRDAILKLLSDDEIARVSTAETAARLMDGDEYVDLEVPDQGVRTALGSSSIPMGRVLPKKAVLEKTWREIVALLSAYRAEAGGPPTKGAS
ncbi:MAG: hypothetical protein RJA70_486 [Pseudomonadota bacterium]|jgi:hypothetical protein